MVLTGDESAGKVRCPLLILYHFFIKSCILYGSWIQILLEKRKGVQDVLSSRRGAALRTPT